MGKSGISFPWIASCVHTARCFITNSWQLMVGVGSARTESQPGGITSDAEAHFDCVVVSICRDVGISCHELAPRDTEPRVRQRCRGRCRRLSLRRDDSRPRCKCPIQLCRFACDIAEGTFGNDSRRHPQMDPRTRHRIRAAGVTVKLAQNPLTKLPRLVGPPDRQSQTLLSIDSRRLIHGNCRPR